MSHSLFFKNLTCSNSSAPSATTFLPSLWHKEIILEMMILLSSVNPFEFLKNLWSILIASKSNSEIIFKELPKDDPVKRQPDISLAKEKLNWQPKYKLEDGLKKTIEYFEDYLKNKKY